MCSISSGVSFPSWERGLKPRKKHVSHDGAWVVPLVGTWIETPGRWTCHNCRSVVPLVGTWIETIVKVDGIVYSGAVVPLVGTWIETERDCKSRDTC